MRLRSQIALVAFLQIWLFQQLLADQVCKSPSCASAAEQFLSGIDNKTEPCDDFYQFACGRWIQEYELDGRDVKAMVPQESHEWKLLTLLEMQPGKDEPPIMSKMRNMYASCMNESHIEARGDKPLLDTLASLGGWPVLMENSASYNTSWLDLLGKFRRLGLSHDMLIDASVVVYEEQTFIELDNKLPAPDYNGTAYYEMMVESALVLGANRTEAESQMFEAYKFELSLGEISSSKKESYIHQGSALYMIAPDIDWRRYFNILLGDNRYDWMNRGVIISETQFLRGLNHLLIFADHRTVANYMIWRVVRASMKSLSIKWRDHEETYGQLIYSRQYNFPPFRCLLCLRSLRGETENEVFNKKAGAYDLHNTRLYGFNLALAALFVKHHIEKETITVVREIAEMIRDQFSKTINESDWLDNETRAEAQSKLQNMLFLIGYPDELLQDEVIEDYYRGLEIKEGDDFYSNVKQLNLWSTNYAFNQLGKPFKRNDWRWYDTAYSSVASHSPTENSLKIPAWKIVKNIGSVVPNFINFSTDGFTIGHEITHGFDGGCRKFDKDGRWRNWWTMGVDSRFENRAQCLIDQFSNYTVKGLEMKMDGESKLDESIADNGGIKHAFKAYQRWARDHGPEARLPHLDYTPEQLFWISYANSLCTKYRLAWIENFLKSDAHPPYEYMVKVHLSNLAEFAESFNCPLGSRMNPIKKCSVW